MAREGPTGRVTFEHHVQGPAVNDRSPGETFAWGLGEVEQLLQAESKQTAAALTLSLCGRGRQQGTQPHPGEAAVNRAPLSLGSSQCTQLELHSGLAHHTG